MYTSTQNSLQCLRTHKQRRFACHWRLYSYTGGGSSVAGFGVRNARMLCWPSICLSGRRLEPALAGFLLGGVGLLLVPGLG